MESEEEDQLLAGKLNTQSAVLSTMQKTIAKMSQDCRPTKPIQQPEEFSFAENFEQGMKERHEELEGLRDGFVVIPESSDEDDNRSRPALTDNSYTAAAPSHLQDGFSSLMPNSNRGVLY